MREIPGRTTIRYEYEDPINASLELMELRRGLAEKNFGLELDPKKLASLDSIVTQTGIVLEAKDRSQVVYRVFKSDQGTTEQFIGPKRRLEIMVPGGVPDAKHMILVDVYSGRLAE